MKHLLTALCLLMFSQLGAATVTIDSGHTYQHIEGFGTCLVSWGKTARSDFYNEAMAKAYVEDMGLNILRVNIAPWAYPHTENADEISYKKIDLAAKKNSRVPVFIEFAKKIKALNPDVKIIGSVWSPPPWMKINKEITGGKGKKKEPSIHATSYKKKGQESRNRMDPKYYQHFCNLMVEMCKLHKEAGVPFYALSAGNEVRFSQDFESCVWTGKDYATIVAMLGETLEKNGFGDVLIFGPETMTKHNYKGANLTYIDELKANKKAMEQLDVFATHGYVDGFAVDMSSESSTEFWNLIKEYKKPYWMTEGGTGGHDWPEPLTAVASGMHNAFVAGNASAFVPWQVASANGDKNTHALMAGRTMTKKSHAARHFSYFINDGAYRVKANSKDSSCLISAFKHPVSKRLVIVIINTKDNAEELTINIQNDSIGSLACYRTSATENLKHIQDLPVKNGAVSLKMEALSMVSLVGAN